MLAMAQCRVAFSGNTSLIATFSSFANVTSLVENCYM